MLSRILIPLDGSPLGASILPLLAQLAEPSVEVKLLTVLPTDEGREEAEARLADYAGELAGTGATISCLVATGDPAQQILAAATLWEADLITMATHGRTGVARFVRGSVAERVLRTSTAPVLLCNRVGTEARSSCEHILVPLDGSKLAGEILPMVAALARRYGSRVSLLHVGEGESDEALSAMDLARLEDSLSEHRFLLEKAGVASLQLLKATGDPASEILAIAEREQVDLVAMSTHGRSGVARWWFGSVAEAVLRTCPPPVLVRPAAATATHSLRPPRAFAQARDLMHEVVATVSVDLSVEGFLSEVADEPANTFPVLNQAGQAVGVISLNDVLRALAQLVGQPDFPKELRASDHKASALLIAEQLDPAIKVDLTQLLHLPVGDLMTSAVVHCGPEAPLAQVSSLMSSGDVHRIYVLDEARCLLGVISARGLIEFLGQDALRTVAEA